MTNGVNFTVTNRPGVEVQPCPVCGKSETVGVMWVNHIPCVCQEHERVEKAERALSRTLDMLVVHGFDAEEHGGKLIVHQNVRAMTIPAGAKERIRAVVEADDE